MGRRAKNQVIIIETIQENYFKLSFVDVAALSRFASELCTRFFYENTLYKNIQDEIYQKVKNDVKNMFILHFC